MAHSLKFLFFLLIIYCEGATQCRYKFYEAAGEIFLNQSGNDPDGDRDGINGESKLDTNKNVHSAPGKGIYNDADQERYVKVLNTNLVFDTEWTIGTWLKSTNNINELVYLKIYDGLDVADLTDRFTLSIQGTNIRFTLLNSSDNGVNDSGMQASTHIDDRWEFHTFAFEHAFDGAKLKYFQGSAEQASSVINTNGSWSIPSNAELQMSVTFDGYIYDVTILDIYQIDVNAIEIDTQPYPSATCGVEQNPDCSGTCDLSCGINIYWVDDINDCNACDRWANKSWSYDLILKQQEWLTCHADWLSCEGATNNDWLECDAFKIKFPTNVPPFQCLTTCPDGYYGVGSGATIASCEPCDTTCATWLTSGSNQWQTCNGNFQEPVPISPGTCAWQSGYVDVSGATPLDWQTCHMSCDGCTTPLSSDHCIAWAVSFYLIDGTNTCTSAWPTNYTANNVAWTWEAVTCASEWSTCSGPSSTECLTCNANFFKQPTTDQCLSICPNGYLQNSVSHACDQCDTSCATCQGTVDNCVDCAVGFYKNLDFGTVCVASWPSQYYLNSENSTCEQCSQPWAECIGPLENNCVACDSSFHALTSDNRCDWKDSYFRSDSGSTFSWIQCHQNWATWFGSGAEECDTWELAEAIALNGKCECRQSFITQSESPLTWVCPDNYEINQSRQVCDLKWQAGQYKSGSQCIACPLGCEACVQVDSCTRCADGYNLYNDLCNACDVQCSICTNTGCSSWKGELVLLGESWTWATPQIVNETYDRWVPPDESSEETDSDEDEENAERITEVGSIVIVSLSLVLAVMSQNPSALWRLINYSQILYLFSLHNLDTTTVLDGFLSSLLKESRIPNVYDYILDSEYDAVEMPSRFTGSYDYPLILDIFGHVLTLWILIIFVLLLWYLLKNWSIQKISNLSVSILDMLVYNGLIQMLMESWVYIFLACFLTFRYGVENEAHSIVNTCISIAFILMIMGFCYGVYKKISANSARLQDESYKKWSELIKDLKDSQSKFIIYAALIFVIRRAVLCAIVVFVQSPEVSLGLSATFNTASLIWLLQTRPYSSMFVNTVEITGESAIVMINFSLMGFISDNDMEKELGIGIIAIALCALSGYLVLIIRNAVNKVLEKFRKRSQVNPVIELNKTQATEESRDVKIEPDTPQFKDAPPPEWQEAHGPDVSIEAENENRPTTPITETDVAEAELSPDTSNFLQPLRQ